MKHLLRFGHRPEFFAPEFRTEGNSVRTEGLPRVGQRDFVVHVDDPELIAAARAFLVFVNNWIAKEHVGIHGGDTMGYGSFVVRFVENDSGLLEAREAESGGSGATRGMDRGLRMTQEQSRVCARVGSEIHITRGHLSAKAHVPLDSIDVISRRHAPTERESGWSFHSRNRLDEPDKHVHISDVIRARPDVARYLWLAPGFTVELDPERIYGGDA